MLLKLKPRKMDMVIIIPFAWGVESLFWIADQHDGIFDPVKIPFIAADIISSAANCHEADSRICFP